MKSSIFTFLLISLFLLSLNFVSAISINTTCENQNGNTSIIADHDISCNSTINLDSGNRLDTVQSNLSGTVTNIKDPSLILCYNFDNRSSLGENDTYVVDWCGGNNGTVKSIINATWQNNGKYNGAYNFNGDVNGYIDLGTPAALNFTNNFTISLWVKPNTDLTAVTRSVFIGKGYDASNFGFNFGYTGSNDAIEFRINGDDSNGNTTYYGYDLGTTQWTHLAVTYASGTAKIYVNGILKSTDTGLTNMNQLDARNFLIAAANTGGSYKSNVSLDEIRIFNKSLSANEIDTQYKISCNKFNSSQINCYNNLTSINSLSQIYALYANDTLGNNITSNPQTINRHNNINLNLISIGLINNNFYGVNAINWFTSGRTIDSNNDGSADIASNYTWHQDRLRDSKINYVRWDANLEFKYSNTTNPDGVNFTGNLSTFINQLQYYSQHNIKSLVIIDYMPSWLADNSSGQCSNLNYCVPSNYTKWNNIVLDYINRVGCTPDICEFEIWNEPYGGFLLGNLASDNINKATNYSLIYNSTYLAIKNNNSNYKVGGPAGNYRRVNMMNTFLANFANQSDFITVHPYETSFVLNDILTEVQNTTSLMASYGSNISRIVLSEWNTDNATLQNVTSPLYDFNYIPIYNIQISYALSRLLNSGLNISNNMYIWAYPVQYAHRTESQYYAFLSEPLMENRLYSPYNVISNLSRYCPSGWSVYNTSNDYNAGIVQVYCTDGTNKGIITTNIENNQQNITINGLSPNELLIDINSTNLLQANSSGSISGLVLDNYSVNSYTTPNLTLIEGVGLNKTNYLGEQIGTPSDEINISSRKKTSLDITYNISSSVNATADLVLDIDKCEYANNVYYTPKNSVTISPNYTCSAGILTVEDVNINPSSESNVLFVSISEATVDTQDNGTLALVSIIKGLGFLGFVVIMGIVLFIIRGSMKGNLDEIAEEGTFGLLLNIIIWILVAVLVVVLIIALV